MRRGRPVGQAEATRLERVDLPASILVSSRRKTRDRAYPAMVTPLVYATCALIWGTTWFAIRRCIGPGGYPTLAAAAIRFAIAALVIGALWAAGRARPGP